MSWAMVAIGTMAALTVDSQQKQRTSINKQRDAMLKAQDDDARQKAESETGAALSANASLSASKRRRKASSLLAGAGGTPSLGGASSLLGASPNMNQGPT